MNKPIAERFEDEFGDEEATLEYSFEFILDWLKKQPENSRTFTLAEVEQIAREAHGNAAETNFPFALFWANKLKELNKY